MTETVVTQPSGRDLLAPEARPVAGTMPGSAILLLLIACGAAVLGIGSLSQATMGVGFLAIACFLGICARIAQAGAQHKALMLR